MKKSILFVALSFGLLNLSCSGNEKKTIQKMPAIPVGVAKVQTQSQTQKITASGTIEAKNSANISTRMMGYVKQIHVKVGQKVQQGQRLVSVSSADLQAKKAQVEAQIQKAEAGYANAEKDYKRFVALFNNQSASQKELDDMTTRYEMAQSGLETAKQMRNEINAQFTYAELKAPFSGVVTNTFVKVGDMANPGMPLVTVEGAKQYQVITMVSEQDIVKIKNNMLATVVVKSSEEAIKGTVIEVSQSAKNTGGQYLVKLVLEPTKSKVLPGMFVHVAFEVPASEKELLENATIYINKKHLVTKGQLQGVYAVAENVALLRWLRLGAEQDERVEVLSGLSEGEQYIIDAQGKLYNGAPVQVQK